GEDGCEVLHGSEGYYVGAREIGTGEQGFGSVGDYIDVGQCKCAGYFAEESGFLVIRFDEREVEERGIRRRNLCRGRGKCSGWWSVGSGQHLPAVARADDGSCRGPSTPPRHPRRGWRGCAQDDTGWGIV